MELEFSRGMAAGRSQQTSNINEPQEPEGDREGSQSRRRRCSFATPCAWETARQRLEAMGKLRCGWDGCAAPAIDRDVIAHAQRVLDRLCRPGVPEPSVVPGPDGSIQIEWHTRSFDAEVHVAGPARWTCMRRTRSPARSSCSPILQRSIRFAPLPTRSPSSHESTW